MSSVRSNDPIKAIDQIDKRFEVRRHREVSANAIPLASTKWSRFLGTLSTLTALSAIALLSGCGKDDKTTPTNGATSAANSAASASVTSSASAASHPGTPNYGGITKVTREVEAVGSTQELAVLAALQMAIAQVNGVRVASQMQAVRASMDLTVNGQSGGSVRSESFVQKMISASQGAVTGFEITSQEEIDKIDEEAISRVRASDGGYSYSASASSEASVDVKSSANASAQYAGGGNSGSAQANGSVSGSSNSSDKASINVKRGATSYDSDATYKKMRSYWKVRVKVDVAQYQAPEEKGRPKIVVALPRTLAAKYPVGDSTVASSEVAKAVRARLSDMLTQTKRFIVLDREFDQEMQGEIDKINSGTVRVQDGARLGQQLATDLILIPTIERFEYPRHVQELRMSDRKLVSYSGGGRITLRLLNATTGEVVMSESFEHQLKSADPSTMPRVIDGKSMAANLMDTLSGRMGKAIVSDIFPVTVVALTGDQAVLSQGGDSLKVGERWQAVALGEELKDPQTGRSLGRHEVPIGILRIDRVSNQTSYGTFEAGAPNLNGVPFKAGSIELKTLAKADGNPIGSTPTAQVSSQAGIQSPAVTPTASAKSRSAAATSSGANGSTKAPEERPPTSDSTVSPNSDDKW